MLQMNPPVTASQVLPAALAKNIRYKPIPAITTPIKVAAQRLKRDLDSLDGLRLGDLVLRVDFLFEVDLVAIKMMPLNN